MPMFLKKSRFAVPSVPQDDDHNVEYSFAMEYAGPPVTYSIPQVLPFDMDHVPIATTAAVMSEKISVPVIQPIGRTKLGKIQRVDICIPSEPNRWEQGVIADKCDENMWTRVDSSDTFRVLDHDSNSQELDEKLGTLEISEVDHDAGFLHEETVFQTEIKPASSKSAKSGSSSHEVFSEIFSCREDDSNNDSGDTPRHVKKPSVTFRDPELGDVLVHEEFGHSESEPGSTPVRTRDESLKRRSCYRCRGGNRFTEKEVCIVCGCKYCYHCVLRAMGSMPEGRKCIECIGRRIDESNRGKLGKCSRLLKRLLTDTQLQQVMKDEMLCEANQIPGEKIFVNGDALTQEKMNLLQRCANPPKMLKPGSYWYDKVSGLWGKEGRKPCQVISPHLSVGGHIRKNASNGDTNVVVNYREITKPERLMLKLVGVQLEGRPCFWVDADGSYLEEGQKNVKGNIWDKPGAKVICKMLSLPYPSGSVNSSGEEMQSTKSDNQERKSQHKLLLVGYEKSGTSTIYKQAKRLYNVPFSEEERQNIKLLIQSNLYGYLGVLLDGRERFEEECLTKMKGRMIDESTSSEETSSKTVFSIAPRLKPFSDWLLKVMASGNLDTIFPDATQKYANFVEELWNDPAIQATYNRRDKIEMLPRGANYFLNKAVEIARVDYEPSDMDILYAEGISSSNSIASMEFSFPELANDDKLDPFYQHDPSLIYQLIRLHPRNLGENCKWSEMFEDVEIVVFCVSLADYGEFYEDINGVITNKMMASRQLFETIITRPDFEKKKFLLVLNKFDLLEENIEDVPLTKCEWFHDFRPFISHNQRRGNNSNTSLAHAAFLYIAMKFKRLFNSLTDGKLFVSMVTALEADTVDEAFRYAREIEKWGHKEDISSINELSSTSNEASTY